MLKSIALSLGFHSHNSIVLRHFKDRIWLGILVIIFCGLLSCQDSKKPSRKQLMDDALAERMNEYRTKKYQECKKKFLTEIEYEVDSMMYYLVEKMKGKSDEIPVRPNRPSRLVDTIELYTLDSTKTILN